MKLMQHEHSIAKSQKSAEAFSRREVPLGSGANISVALATYNGERFLAEQLESLVRQTRKPDELVVSDDCSTDKTCELVQSFAAEAPFPVRLLANSCNLGVNGNFDRAIAACGGEIILPCDQDDVWVPQKIQKMADVLGRNATAVMAISNSEVVDGGLRPIGRNLYALKFPEVEQLHRRGIEAIRFLLRNWAVAGHTMAFRRVPELTTPSRQIAADCTYDFFRAMIAGGTSDVVTIPDRLTKYRRHADQVTNQWTLLPTRLEKLRQKILNVLRSEKAVTLECKEFARDLLQVRDGLRRFGGDETAIDFLQGHAAMVLFQANLRSYPRFRRVPQIRRCLVDGQYHKYARGTLTALQDLCLSSIGE